MPSLPHDCFISSSAWKMDDLPLLLSPKRRLISAKPTLACSNAFQLKTAKIRSKWGARSCLTSWADSDQRGGRPPSCAKRSGCRYNAQFNSRFSVVKPTSCSVRANSRAVWPERDSKALTSALISLFCMTTTVAIARHDVRASRALAARSGYGKPEPVGRSFVLTAAHGAGAFWRTRSSTCTTVWTYDLTCGSWPQVLRIPKCTSKAGSAWGPS